MNTLPDDWRVIALVPYCHYYAAPYGLSQAVFASNASVASSLSSGASLLSATTQTLLVSVLPLLRISDLFATS